MNKLCKSCEIEKEIKDFYLKPNGSTKSSFCKICYNNKYKKKYDPKYYLDNKDKFKESYKKYILENDRKEYNREYREKNSDILKLKNKEFRNNNKDLVSSRKKNYYDNLSPEKKEELKIKKRENYTKNKDKYCEVKNKYIKSRLENDPFFKLKFNIRSLIRNSLKRKFTEKSKKTNEILGCSYEEFKLHLESKFDGNMNWENQGSYWHMDHIIPISSAETEEDVYRLNHYTNFQPLYWEDNLKKGNKLFSN